MHPAAIGLDRLAALTPDDAVLLLTAGVFLIFLELNRPGWIIPGALGLLAALFAMASLFRQVLSMPAVVLMCTAIALLLLDLRRRTPAIVSIAATIALISGFSHLVARGEPRVRIGTAVGCGALIGATTAILTRIARRARTNKGLD